MSSMLPPFGWAAMFQTWDTKPVWDALALLALVTYGAGLLAARRRGVRAVPPARVASFVLGLALLVATLNSAIEVYAMTLFWVHMVEHLMLIMVVPALLVVGHPLTVLRSAVAPRHAPTVDRVLMSAPVSVLTNVFVATGIYSAVIVATHLTSFMDQMVVHPWLMPAEQALYVVAGYLFLLPLLGHEPIRSQIPPLFRVAMLLFAMAPDTVVGIVLMQSGRNLFPTMEAAHPAWAPPAVHDINIAGGLMWAAGDGLMMVFAVAVVLELITHPDRGGALGSWLENVRRSTMAAHVTTDADAEEPAFADGANIDDDAAALAAYNRMLARLNQHGGS